MQNGMLAQCCDTLFENSMEMETIVNIVMARNIWCVFLEKHTFHPKIQTFNNFINGI